MDNLARNAMLARQNGMSYGKWMSLQSVVQIKKKETIPEGWRKCERCGRPFNGKNKMQRFCDVTCQKQAYNEKVRKEKKHETESST